MFFPSMLFARLFSAAKPETFSLFSLFRVAKAHQNFFPVKTEFFLYNLFVFPLMNFLEGRKRNTRARAHTHYLVPPPPDKNNNKHLTMTVPYYYFLKQISIPNQKHSLLTTTSRCVCLFVVLIVVLILEKKINPCSLFLLKTLAHICVIFASFWRVDVSSPPARTPKLRKYQRQLKRVVGEGKRLQKPEHACRGMRVGGVLLANMVDTGQEERVVQRVLQIQQILKGKCSQYTFVSTAILSTLTWGVNPTEPSGSYF